MRDIVFGMPLPYAVAVRSSTYKRGEEAGEGLEGGWKELAANKCQTLSYKDYYNS